MSDDQKLGQVLLVHLRWVAKGETGYSLDDKQREELRRIQPGGVVLYAQNLGTVEQTVALIQDIRAQCLIPPFIAIDEEGGRVSRLTTSKAIRATRVPPARDLAAAGPETVSGAYRLMGLELAALGFNMDFAPVADLGLPESDSIIGDRAFGTDPKEVAVLVGLAIQGLQDAGVCAVLKHYPGHGRSHGDSHFGKQTVTADWNTLLYSDLVPFREAIRRNVGGMMTAHIEFPNIDAKSLPVSLSGVLLQEKLRGELGFGGLVITDALDMQGVLTAGNGQMIALKSLEAGVDMLLSPTDPLQLKDYLARAQKNGSLDIRKIDAACQRILEAKNRFGILGTTAKAHPAIIAKTVVGSVDHLRTMRDLLPKKP